MNIVSELRLLSNGLIPHTESELMRAAADEVERLRAERDEAKTRIVRLMSQLQEYEAREQ